MTQRDPAPPGTRRLLVGVGSLWILAGGLVCFLALRVILRSAGGTGGMLLPLQLALAAAGLLAALLGVVTLLLRSRPWIARLQAVLVVNLVVSALLLEGLLRGGIALGVPALRNPKLYANEYLDDDFFKLLVRWRPEARDVQDQGAALSPIVHDAELGWAHARSAENPLGALTDRPYRVRAAAPAVLFFGDSFFAHGESIDDMIPQRAAELLPPGVQAWSFGMGGYGIDQIYLAFRRQLAVFERPHLVIGLFPPDMDRCILRFRSRPKPWFAVEGGELELRGVPTQPDLEAWLEANPVSIRSYAAAAAWRAFRYLGAGSSLAVSDRRAEKERLTSLLLEAFVRDARAARAELLFVVFAPSVGEGWRKRHLLEELARLRAPTLDAERLLRDALPRGARFADFYDHTGHLDSRANALVAESIAARLRASLSREREPDSGAPEATDR